MASIRSHAAITCRTLTGSATDATRGRDDAIIVTDHGLELLSPVADQTRLNKRSSPAPPDAPRSRQS
jgi:hypothetical protein